MESKAISAFNLKLKLKLTEAEHGNKNKLTTSYLHPISIAAKIRTTIMIIITTTTHTTKHPLDNEGLTSA